MVEGIQQDLVLGPEAREGRDAGQGQDAGQVHPLGNGQALPQAAHVAHVLRVKVVAATCTRSTAESGRFLAAMFARRRGVRVVAALAAAAMGVRCRLEVMVAVLQGVDDRAGREEQQGLEEGVRHQVEHAGHVARQPHRGDHEAKLGDGGIGQHLLDVELGHGHGGGKERGGRADIGHHRLRDGRQRKQRVGARDHVNAGRHHGGGVDERRDRRGAGHGVRQPDIERDLRALAGGAQQQQQGDGRDDGLALRVQPDRGHGAKDLAKGQRAKGPEDQEHGQQHGPVAHAVDHKGLAPGAGIAHAVLALLVPETDEQVRAQAHAFPAHEHGQVTVARHQDEHGGQEQVEVDKEAREAARVAVDAHVLVHVANGVDVDERANAGDDQHHGHRERVDQEGPLDVQAAEAQPLGHAHGVGRVAVGAQGKKHQQRDDERQPRGGGGHQAHPLFAQAAAPGQVDQQAGDGESDDERQQVKQAAAPAVALLGQRRGPGHGRQRGGSGARQQAGAQEVPKVCTRKHALSPSTG